MSQDWLPLRIQPVGSRLNLQNLLGFAAPIAVRLLQLRHTVRLSPNLSAASVIDPLMLRLLMAHFKFATLLTLNQFWLAVARLGGYVGQPLIHPPGWRSIWAGWHTLSPGLKVFAFLPLEHVFCVTISLKAL